MPQATAENSRVELPKTNRPADADIECSIYYLRNAVRVLSCVVAYHFEHPKGPPERSDWHQFVQPFDVDPITITTATERVAEIAEDLYETVCDPDGPKRRSLEVAWKKATEEERATFLDWARPIQTRR